jgi:hypothetical protein
VKPIRLFTIVWGERYLDWFEQACARSLCWPRNRLAAQRLEAWDLWTTPAEAARAEAIAGQLGVPLCLHATLDKAKVKENVYGSLMAQMILCAEQGGAFLFAAPDSIFGDGSVGALLDLGAPARVCVATAPLRVRESILPELSSPRANAALVALGFEHMHASFRDAKGGERTNSLSTGMSWRELGDGLYALQYRNHSSYLLTPQRHDIDWFRANPRFGYYDGRFPEVLVKDQRQRVVGSSDAVFVCEVTPESRPLPPISQADAQEPDRFEHGLPHHVVNRNTLCIWRAEKGAA